MSIELNISTDIAEDPVADMLVRYIKDHFLDLDLDGAVLYYDYPLYRNEEDGGIIASKVLLLSKRHGVIVFGTSSATVVKAQNALGDEIASTEQVFSHIFARLIKNRKLKQSKLALAFPFSAFLFAPHVRAKPNEWDHETPLLINVAQVRDEINAQKQTQPMAEEMVLELTSTIEGAKGLVRPKKRETEQTGAESKGNQAMQLESEICNFDHKQKHGSIISIEGPQRIRGLAGSGKTIVLAMKAALTHLRYPEAKILYTFHTKSLYQHIKRLITRFYRQFDDRDPDWDRLQIMHSWGGRSWPGVYYVGCVSNGVTPLTYPDALEFDKANPFDYVCRTLLKQRPKLTPSFDYLFIDEGQDFPMSFLQVATQLVKDRRFVLAYDELQNIFQIKAPTALEILGRDDEGNPAEFSEDVVLHKCYRNPREVLVVAHALGFGIYGETIVQMLENEEHWEDIGYRVTEGKLEPRSHVRIERPEANSLRSISSQSSVEEMIKTSTYATVDEEIRGTVACIAADIKEGLRPDDILVISIDDRNAKLYLSRIASALVARGIGANNIHQGNFGLQDFQEDGQVTLSTVHKAKGNEAFMVYVVGVDALFSPRPTVRHRNMLFTALTRAKGWVRVSGIEPAAKAFEKEVVAAKKNFPFLDFTYPSAEQLRVMKRDLEESASRRLKVERLLEEARDMTPDEIEELVATLGQGNKSTQARRKRGDA